MQTQHNKGNDDYAFAHIAHNTNQIQSNLRTPELIEQCDNYQTTAEGASLPNWAVVSGRHQRWAAPLCSVLLRLVSIRPTRWTSPSSTRMLVFILLPVVGEFDFGSEETIILDLFQRWWSGSLRGRGTVLTVRSGSACTGGEIMSKCAEGYSSSETIIFTSKSKSEWHNNNLDLSITDRAGPGSSVKMETVSRGER